MFVQSHFPVHSYSWYTSSSTDLTSYQYESVDAKYEHILLQIPAQSQNSSRTPLREKDSWVYVVLPLANNDC